VLERLDTAEQLSDADRETLTQIARKSLARFQPEPEAKANSEVPAEVKPKPGPEEKS